MASDMVERVARALALSAGSKITGGGRHAATDEFAWGLDGAAEEKYVEAHWKEHVHASGFAIAAMREPTDVMTAAGADVIEADDRMDAEALVRNAAAIYRAMIDAAVNGLWE